MTFHYKVCRNSCQLPTAMLLAVGIFETKPLRVLSLLHGILPSSIAAVILAFNAIKEYILQQNIFG